MKSTTTLLVLMILLTSYPLSAQTKDNYLLKSKHQKTAAWIMLGGGAGVLIVGGIVGAHGFFDVFTGQFDKADNNLALAGISDVTGCGAMLASIPLLLCQQKISTRL